MPVNYSFIADIVGVGVGETAVAPADSGQSASGIIVEETLPSGQSIRDGD